MVGHRTGLDKAYPHKGIFFELNNYFRVSKTDFAKKIADTVGFMRPDARVKSNFSPKDKEYEQFSIGEPPFDKNYGDVGVVANWYIDKNKLGTKLSLKMNKCLGTCKEYGGDYGMVIDDLVFHLVLGYADDYMSKKEQEKLGEDFLKIKELINNRASSDLIDQLVNKTRPSNEHRMRTFISNDNFYYEPVSNEMNSIIDKIKMEE
jgi:hypothetical protein